MFFFFAFFLLLLYPLNFIKALCLEAQQHQKDLQVLHPERNYVNHFLKLHRIKLTPRH